MSPAAIKQSDVSAPRSSATHANEVLVAAGTVPRRSFLESLAAIPLGLSAGSHPQGSRPAVEMVAAGAGRSGSVLKLPGGDLLYLKIATQDTGGTLFLTEQPITRRGSGPPKHY